MRLMPLRLKHFLQCMSLFKILKFSFRSGSMVRVLGVGFWFYHVFAFRVCGSTSFLRWFSLQLDGNKPPHPRACILFRHLLFWAPIGTMSEFDPLQFHLINHNISTLLQFLLKSMFIIPWDGNFYFFVLCCKNGFLFEILRRSLDVISFSWLLGIMFIS